MNNVHFSSKTDQWSTPPDFFAKVAERFDFVLDACASQENTKCDTFIPVEGNSLKQDWRGIVADLCGGCIWMNPPYGRGIGAWIKKAYEASLQGVTVVCLLPARTDTKWFHDYCVRGEIEFIKGRLKFGGHKWNAPFPSMLVVFRGAL